MQKLPLHIVSQELATKMWPRGSFVERPRYHQKLPTKLQVELDAILAEEILVIEMSRG